jgi:hypothetical protein
MSTRIPLTAIKTNARERWHGMPWDRYGNAAGQAYLDTQFPERLAWLDQHCQDQWSVCTEVFMGKLPTAAEAHNGQVQQVTMGVSLCFDDPGYAVLYKLTWGKHE